MGEEKKKKTKEIVISYSCSRTPLENGNVFNVSGGRKKKKNHGVLNWMTKHSTSQRKEVNRISRVRKRPILTQYALSTPLA